MAMASLELLTAEEFARLPNPPDGSYDELVRGQVVNVGPCHTARHGFTCAAIAVRLQNYVWRFQLGHATLRCGVILRRNPDTVRGPDAMYWSAARLPELIDDYLETPPDLVVEVLECYESNVSVAERVRDFIEAGVAMVWLVDPDTKTVTVYSGTMRGIEYDEADTLDGGSVLPGFTCPVAELFR